LTDTEDYYDYGIGEGVDPNDYESFASYWAALQKKMPVQNWGQFETEAKSNFKSDLRSRYNRAKDKQEEFDKMAKDAKRRREVKHSVKNAIRIQKRTHKLKGTKATKSQKRTWEGIKKKAIADKTYSKTQSKELQSAKMNRVHELVRSGKYTMKEAWVRVRIEYEGL